MANTCNPYRDLLRLAARARKRGLLKSFRGDLIKHDKRSLKGYCGPYLWGVREGGTHLLTPVGACYWRNNKEAWDATTRGEHGRAEVYYSPGDGRAPKRVSGGVPGRIADRWERACKVRFDPWTGRPSR